MPSHGKLRILAAYATLCVVWSSTWLVIKIGLGDLPPVSFAAIRFVIAFLVLVAVSVGRVPLLPKRRADWILLASTGVLMFAINYGLLPEEPLRWQQLGGAAIAIGGVALICSRLFGHGGILAFWGGLGISLGGAGAAFSNVLLKRHALQLAPAMIAAWQMIFGSIPLFSLGLLLDGNPMRFHWSGRALFCLLYLALIGSALTFLLLYWLLPRMQVNKLQTISLITPPGAVALGWLLGGEIFSLWSLVGGALVLSGVWIIFRRPEPAAAIASDVGLLSTKQ